MAREFRHALDDMRAAIDGIEAAVAGKTIDDYKTDWLLKHAVQRGIEIISEASRALPDEVTGLRPEIPWRQVRRSSPSFFHTSECGKSAKNSEQTYCD